MDPHEDLIDHDILLTVQLPGGQETTATVHGSKPVMDVLVTLCAQHHLAPSDHVIKLISTNQNHINFKPNSPIGSLEFEKVVLQAKGSDDANSKKPHIPVATVRLMINYKKSHKAVVRVNPRVPLVELMPSVCEKCEFNRDTTILLRTCESEEPLDLTKTLNDYGIRELYAKDTRGGDEEQKKTVKEKNQREKGNKRFFGLFKKSKKTSEQALTLSAPGSPELNNLAVGVTCLNGHSTAPTAAVDMSKKRRAPQPPLTSSLSVAYGLNTKDFAELSERDAAGKQGMLSRISSTESSLKRTKRRAPPPPCDGPSDADNKENCEEDDNSSDTYRTRIVDRCPAIAQVMTELMESLQARQQRELSSVNSATSQHQTTEDSIGQFSEPSSPEAELKAPPGCQLKRNSSEREGLTTFTVVPKRCQQSRKCFEVALTLQAPDTAKAGAEKELSPGASEDLDSAKIVESVVQTDLCRNGGNGLDKRENLTEIPHLQHLEEESKAWMDRKIENLEQKYEKHSIHLKNIKQGGLESFQRGFNNQQPLGSKMNNLELRNGDLKSSELTDTLTSNLQPINKPTESPVASNIEESYLEQKEKQEFALVETVQERNWIEEYKERRRKFLGGYDDDGRRKLDSWGRIKRALRNTQMETMMQEVDDHFPPPPSPVCWYENNSEGENNNEKENERDQEMDTATNTQAGDADLGKWPNIEGDFNQDAGLNSNPKIKPFSHLSKPKACSTQSNLEPNTSGADSSSTPEPSGSFFLTSRTNSGCTFKSRSISDHCSPEPVSLFALAVFQKAKHFRPGPDHRMEVGDAHTQ